jgi:TonB family protein
MRIQFAIILSLMCGPVLAGGSGDVQFSTTIPIDGKHVAELRPLSVGRPHECSAYYPPAALKAYAQGTTLLAFTVTAEGGVRDINISKSSGNKDLDDASVNCASHWRYKPATKDSVAIEIPWMANVVWKMRAPPETEAAVSCLFYREDRSAPPMNLGHTMLAFRVDQTGSVTEVAVTKSSGYSEWDTIGAECARGRRFDFTMFTLPSEGLSGHWDIDWLGAIALAVPN